MDLDDLLFSYSETRQSFNGMLNEDFSEEQTPGGFADEFGFEDDLFEIGEECDFFDTDDECDLFNAGVDHDLLDASPRETTDARRFPLNSTGLLALSDDDLIMQENGSAGAVVQSDERFKQQHRDR
ncbi:hypothetical protein E8E13_001345 [Curvularia kusanoi]|uniref:Uncharacterized protein n=1 Tax=Curvularia kusanoi TaxID=90978 RepID=A0A9P4TM46_CURKU|nr:hypothetical protein E8E13_001345 [Curvularia kusanoi]